MLPGPQQFLDFVDLIGVRFGWRVFPTRRTLLRCLDEARALNDDSGNPIVEAAAVFFVLAWDERRLGPSAWHILSIAAALRYLYERRLMLRSTEDLGELGWLRHSVAEGSADWLAVRAWFLERTRPRPS